MSQWLLRIAGLYLVAGITLGIVMAASHDHSQMPLHAHLNLLGWVTLGLVGLWYRVQPEASKTLLARIHFTLHNLALPVLAVALYNILRGNEAAEPFEAGASIVIGIGVLCLVANIWRHTAPQATAAAATPARATATP
jgi:UDP-N-acetylmuramyl pentapeptide phosphotransferase/UDP-N-acetylglucosamine-1-phosphate transferase